MYLYHFTSLQHGLQSLCHGWVKLSKFDEMNDPFELLSIASNDKAVRAKIEKLKKHFASNTRLLCCSKSWKSPLLWSHYADRHKGVALKLKVPTKKVLHVDYIESRRMLNKDSWTEHKAGTKKEKYWFLRAKHDGWEYEDEARLVFGLENTVSDGTLDFLRFNGEFELEGIIAGPLCKLTSDDVEKALPTGSKVNLLVSRLAFQNFSVVQNKRIPSTLLVGS